MTLAQTSDAIRDFVGVLFEPTDVIEVRAIHKTHKAKQKWITARDLPSLAARLGQLNDAGFDLYIGANPRKASGGSTNADVACARVLFVDFDGLSLDEVRRCIDEAALPAPSMIVNSGHGYHVYWLLDEPLIDLDLFTRHQQAIIAEVDSDPCIHDPARIMRLVGLLNVKDEPVICEIVESDPARTYSLSDFPEPVSRSISPHTSNGQVDQDERWRAIRYLGQLDPSRAHDYGCWISIGMILHSIGPGEKMLEAWEDWSQQSDKWAAGECARKWATFDPSRPSLINGSLTIATLHQWAIEDRKLAEPIPIRANPLLHESEPSKPASDPQEAASDPTTDPKSNSCKPLIGGVARNEFPPPIPFSELGDSKPVDWVWDGYLAAGSISLLCGLWKAGKTTLLAHVIRACGGGGRVGSKVAACRVLLVTEEPAGMWSRRRDELGIGDHAHCWPRPFKSKPSHGQWRDFIQYIVGLVQEHGYGLVIFDTLGAIAPYVNENDAAEMQATLTPLQAIADTGAAVLLVHHPRKGDGDEGQASRGSGSLTGFVDVIIELRRFDRKDRTDCRRTLTTFSRFDESPPDVVVELTDDGFISLGSRSDANKADRAVTLLDILTTDGQTVKEIKTAWGEQDATPPSEKTIRNDLEYGFSKARWLRAGAGTRGDPYTYRKGATK